MPKPSQLSNDKPIIKSLLKALIGLILIAIVIVLYRQQTTDELSHQLKTLKQENRQLSSQNAKLTEQYKTLVSANLTQRHTAAIQKITNTELLEQLNALQENAIELDKELSFYQNITQGNATTELQVRELKVIADANQANQFRYRLVISQGKKISKPLEGKLTISIKGEVDQQPKILKIKQHVLNLRHVQVFNGPIKLAEDMTPKSVEIILVQNKRTTLSKTIDWKVFSNPGR